MVDFASWLNPFLEKSTVTMSFFSSKDRLNISIDFRAPSCFKSYSLIITLFCHVISYVYLISHVWNTMDMLEGLPIVSEDNLKKVSGILDSSDVLLRLLVQIMPERIDIAERKFDLPVPLFPNRNRALSIFFLFISSNQCMCSYPFFGRSWVAVKSNSIRSLNERKFSNVNFSIIVRYF